MESAVHVHACANCGAVSESIPEPSHAFPPAGIASEAHPTSTPVTPDPANAPAAAQVPRAEPDDLHIEITLPFSGYIRRAAVEVRGRVSANDLRHARRIFAAFVILFLMKVLAVVLKVVGTVMRNVLAKIVGSWAIRITVFAILVFWPGAARLLLPFLDL